MQTTREADYAARAVLYLAHLQSENHVLTNEIAKGRTYRPALQPVWFEAQKDLVTKLRNTNFGQLSVAGTS